MSGQERPQPAPATKAPGPKAEVQRILIVRPTALGDVARTVPCLVTLRTAFPGAQIDWLVSSAFADVVRHHPMLDDVVLFDREAMRGLAYRPSAMRAARALVRRLRQANYDRVYDLQGLARSGLLTWLTRSAARVGFADAREHAAMGYNVRHALPETAKPRHAVPRMLGLLEADGLEAVDDMRLYVGQADRDWAQAYQNENGLEAGRYVCLAPTAQWGCKCWPAERYAQLAQRIVDHEDAGDRVVLLAAPREHDLLKPITEKLGENALLPTTSVGQLAALIAGCGLLVANDSAALHIAVGFDRPCVALFGPTDPAEVGPYQRDDDVLQPPGITSSEMKDYRKRKDDNTLIARLTLEAVWTKVREKLGEMQRPGDA